jgi:signal transduction histidine kinase
MRRPRPDLGGALFAIFFVPYVVGVVVFLTAGLAPSVVKEFGSLHQSLHDSADDALLAESDVTIQLEHLDRETPHHLMILGGGGQPRVLAGSVVQGEGRAIYRFVAPPAGSYRLTSVDDPDLDGEIRFAADGTRSVSIRVPQGQHRFERVGAAGWSEVAHRVADASHRADHPARVTLETLFSALNLGLGLMLIVRRPRDLTARLLAVAMIGTAITFNDQSHSTVREYLIGDWWFAHDLCHLLSGVAYMYAVIVFPDGRLLPLESRHRWLLRTAYGVATLVLAVNVLSGRVEGHPGQRFFAVLFGLLIPLVGVGAQTYRLRRAADPVVRQQSRLLRWALLPMFIGGVTYFVLTRSLGTDEVKDVGLAVFPVLFALVPLALIMGILRYRLWDIDLFVSRALLSVGLAAFIGLVYVAVVVVLGQGLGPGGSAGLKIVATAIVAVAFEPVRERLSRFANRLVYGERATPYEIMAEVSDRLAGAISVDEILPRIAEATVKGVGGLAGRVTAFLPGGGSRTVEWPEAGVVTSFPLVVPVTYQGEEVGQIAVATARGERLRPEAEKLLAALAAQAGLAVNNARLTIELQAHLQEISVQAAELHASRQRIVTARQAQRQQVVQLIHDQVEARLGRVSNMLDELEPLLLTDVEHAIESVDALLDECGDALDALRDLARGIFPAILTDQGVGAALDAYVLQARLPVDVRVDGMDATDRFDPQAEATVYFCVIQALANVGKYAPDSAVVVSLRADTDHLAFSVADDGPGTDPRRLQEGGDIRDMRDRVEAVGGEFDAMTAPGEGTVISGWVPAHTLVVT